MKIGILSMQRVINYGSVLQAYSLKSMLNELTGEEIEFVDIDRSEKIPICGNITTSADYANSQFGIKKKPWLIVRKVKHRLLRKRYEEKIEIFQNKVLGINSSKDDCKFDLVVIGSDEVFNAVDYVCLQLYGKVTNAKNVITYAAASGAAEYKNIRIEDLPRIEDALANISYMSVRDQHTVEYIGKMYKGEIQKHVDPVLAGNLRYRKHGNVPEKRYMIVYAYAERISNLDEINAIKSFARKKKLEIICVGGQQLWCNRFIAISPFEMLDYFYHADYVVTDTFHGTVFSIINHCKFAVLMRKSNQYKLQDLLSKMELTDRLINKVEDLPIILEEEIDYKKVDEILDFERKRSLSYLEICLKDCCK